MKRLLVATGNHGKLKELQALLEGIVETVTPISEYPDFPGTVEDGDTFEANALKKAREASAFAGLPAIADDSGLVVPALGGEPGVRSARYAGEDADDAANNSRLLKEILKVPEDARSAAFVCTIAYVSPDGDEQIFTGRVGGCIITVPRGSEGFGYDPLFLVDGYNRTMAELPLEVKNSISHRGAALARFRSFLEGR